ncbi:hypothetical protein TNIN_404071 [Trichonephila inaurata madagascariensis]|uniref:Uncharacterized protein n=1 Tax=Trichonephila inaurata madagascariensis TaxID=2747483 RepID=A0A8X6J622_9ARAC|nr:hypothetical protein TNIN_404071 [Trichonephila inaurata madagascariensis]
MKAKLKEQALGAYEEVTNGFGRNDKIERGSCLARRTGLNLGRGLRAKSKLRSPLSKIKNIQNENISGQYEWTVKVQLDQFRELADIHNDQIIAIQETKPKEQMKLNIKGFHINRLDRPTEGGGVLQLLVRDVKYQNIAIPHMSIDSGCLYFLG